MIAVSMAADAPVRSLVPYGLTVTLVAWRHGMGAGFLFTCLATLAALAAGAFPTRAEWTGHEVGEDYSPTSAVGNRRRGRSRQAGKKQAAPALACFIFRFLRRPREYSSLT
jgi:hypothetical protein